MDVTTSIVGSKAFIGLTGKMTVQTSPGLGAAVDSLPIDVCDIDVDLAGIDYVSSAGMRALVSAGKAAAQRGGRLRLLSPQERVSGMFDMAGLANVIEIAR